MGALSHIRVLDLSRVLAGPWATQILGDLGAEIIKIEKPGEGDETRHFGPPFLADANGAKADATYFLSANRNKKSVAIDLSQAEGAALVKRLARRAHVVVENFKTGSLAKYGLDYQSLSAENPALIYCSLTGFGHDGPYKDKAGYDYLVQGMAGLMSITGQPDGTPGAEPMKVGVAVSDLLTGLYTTIAILAAIVHQATDGRRPGNRHGIVRLPGGGTCQSGVELSRGQYGADAARQRASQHRAVSGVRDSGWLHHSGGGERCAIPPLCESRRRRSSGGGCALQDQRRARAPSRGAHRADEADLRRADVRTNGSRCWKPPTCPAGPSTGWIRCSPIRRPSRAVSPFRWRIATGPLNLVASPLKLSKTPPDYRLPPPLLGEHTDDVLRDVLNMDGGAIDVLRAKGVVA